MRNNGKNEQGSKRVHSAQLEGYFAMDLSFSFNGYVDFVDLLLPIS